MAEFNWSPEELQEIVDNNRLVLFRRGHRSSRSAGSPTAPRWCYSSSDSRSSPSTYSPTTEQFPRFARGRTFPQCPRYSFTASSSEALT